MKKFWDMKNLDEKCGGILLYGEISDMTWFGDEITPKLFADDLKALGNVKDIDVYVNSPGGDVFAGFTIYNQLKRHEAKITVHVDGLAASAASIVCMAGDTIIMPENATMMIHEATSRARGNKKNMRAMADELDLIDGQIAGIYAARTGKTQEECLALMEAETWMTGAEAHESGFCDEVTKNKKIAACADMEKYENAYKRPLKPPDSKEPPKDRAADRGGILLPENGDESQPVTDKNTLDAQHRRFRMNERKKTMTEG